MNPALHPWSKNWARFEVNLSHYSNFSIPREYERISQREVCHCQKRKSWDVVSSQVQHLLSLPPRAQTAQNSSVSINTCEKCVPGLSWTICKNELEGLEIDLCKIKSPFLFRRSCTKFRYVNFLQYIVTNVGRRLCSSACLSRVGSGRSSWNIKVIHL